jgi:hypothetical protein
MCLGRWFSPFIFMHYRMQDLEVEDTLWFKAPAPNMLSSLAYFKQLWFQAPAPRMLSSSAYSSKLWFQAPAPSVVTSCRFKQALVPSSSSKRVVVFLHTMTTALCGSKLQLKYDIFSIASTYFKHCVQRLLPNAIKSLQPSSPSTSNSLSSNSYGFAVFVVGFTKPSRGERDPMNSISTGHG